MDVSLQNCIRNFQPPENIKVTYRTISAKAVI